MRYIPRILTILLAVAFSGGAPVAQAPAPAKAPVHAKQVKRLLIKNAMVLSGPAVPAAGPLDILLEDGLIARMGNSRNWPEADEIIDATGKYVMPGIVNTHMHWHEERVGPIPIQYERNLYLGGRRHDGPRSGRRVREDQTVAVRERRTHDRRTPHRALPDAREP